MKSFGLVFTTGIGAAIWLMAAAPLPAAGDPYPECHMHRSKPVSFKEHGSKDVLEISIGTGPCYAATLTIVVREESGDVLYSYVANFKRHTAVPWDVPDLAEVAREFVDRELADAMDTTASLPRYEGKEDHYEAHYEAIQVSEGEYERLRAEGRPMLSHENHYEGWQYVVYDPRLAKSVVIVTGGL